MPNTARKNDLPRVGEVVEMPLPQPHQLDEATQIKKLAFWSKLNPAEQDQLLFETDHFLTAQQLYGLTAVEVGQRLLNVQRILTPYGAYLKFLAAYYRESERTAYRKVEHYRTLLELLGRPVVEAMIRNGFNLDGKGNERVTYRRPLGKYTRAYNKLLSNHVIPPVSASEQEALRWVWQLQIEHERLSIGSADLAEVRSRVETPNNVLPIISFNDLLKTDYYRIQSSLNRIPTRQADEYIESLVGYLLTRRGVSGKRFTAQAIPAHFKRPAGRPKDIT